MASIISLQKTTQLGLGVGYMSTRHSTRNQEEKREPCQLVDMTIYWSVWLYNKLKKA
jgi:hypothetical protein